MLKPREELDKLLTQIIQKKSFEANADSVVDYVYEHHNIPKGELNDYISGRKEWSEANDIVAYCFIESFNKIPNNKHLLSYAEKISELYTKSEIGKYSKYKYKPDTIKWPLRIPCYQVAKDQWIGVTDMKLLFQLGEAQLIRYNENAQRIMRKKITGGQEEYIPYVNRKAVDEIAYFFKEGIYIPNTLTLNIPEDVDVSFKYDDETHEIVFNSIQCLDITDGYHRYLAAWKTYQNDKEFNTPIELRITQFSDEKARGFIYQEDQKTKMTKIESKSMQVNAPANIIVERLGSGSTSNLKGLIKRTGGIIDQPNLVSCISKYYLNDRLDLSRAEVIEHYKIVEDFFNTITDADTSLLSKPWTYDYIVAAVLVLSYIEKNKNTKKKGLTYKEVDLNKMIVALSGDIVNTPSQRISASKIEALNKHIESLTKTK